MLGWWHVIEALVQMCVGVGFGAGVWLTLRGAVPRPLPLDVAIARFRAPIAPTVPGPTQSPRLAPMALRVVQAMGIDFGVLRSDLRVAHLSADQFAFNKVMSAAAGAAVPLLIRLVLPLVGASPWWGWTPFVCVIGLAAGFVAPDVRLRERAAERRAAFAHALAAYLDLTKVLVAGGAHVDGALYSAALAGEGWAFGELLDAIDWARTTGHTAALAFERLAHELDVRELRELAASLTLAEQEGAPPGEALSRKAEMMIAHQQFEARVRAESATEQMSVPTVLIALAFLVFLGAPAIGQLFSVANGL